MIHLFGHWSYLEDESLTTWVRISRLVVVAIVNSRRSIAHSLKMDLGVRLSNLQAVAGHHLRGAITCFAKKEISGSTLTVQLVGMEKARVQYQETRPSLGNERLMPVDAS
jgi:hypothetical protein